MSSLDALEARLKDLSEQWKALPLETREQQVAATQFYMEKVFPLIKEVFVAREAPKVKAPIYGLILPLGTSPEPLILSISAIRPEKVLFLYTQATEPLLDTVVAGTGLAPRQWDKRMIDPANPLYIYREIRDAWVRWGRRRDIAVDFTGGTKSMSGGAAMAGALIGAQLVYVANRKYLPDPYRRPEPGSEYLEFVPNPYTVFGDLEEREAASRFRRHDFAGAQLMLEALSERAVQPRRHEALASLAAAYKAWDDLDLSAACEHFERAIQLTEVLRLGNGLSDAFPLAGHLDVLRRQLGNLQALARLMPSKPGESALPLLQDPVGIKSLIFTVYGSAQRQEERGDFDTAALLLYRLLELMSQRRLATYGIDTGDPDYSTLQRDLDHLLSRVNEIVQRLKHGALAQLPRPIGLTDGYILLEALDDPFGLTHAGVNWQRFLSETKARNYSIFAHGFIFVSQAQYSRFKAMVDSLLDLFCAVEGIDRSAARDEYSFVDPWE